jgi:hypothetical protein
VLEPGSPQIGGCEAAAAVAVVRTAGVCKCLQGQSGWQGPTDKVRRLWMVKPMHLLGHCERLRHWHAVIVLLL